ncbi:MAG TPA: zf-HC2 domain-containing protein [Vicinamibacterales bacterium]|nr:zf-HC2 domain-containing protein [Vicinamibacterales bacterium]
MCESQELIVGYLYDDLTESERQTFDAHLVTCVECRDEVAGLRAARGYLASWAPPEPDFGFRVIREPQAPPARVLSMRSRWLPAFGLAAAAVLVLAAATAIANLDVRYDASGLVVRTGWSRLPEPVAQGGARENGVTTAQVSDAATATAVATTDLDLLDRRLRELERAAAPNPVQVAGSPRMSDADLLRRVREMVGDAESRQQTVVAQRLLQVVRDFDRQRQSDLAAIQQGLGSYQGLTNAEIAQQRDMLNQLYRVAARQDR